MNEPFATKEQLYQFIYDIKNLKDEFSTIVQFAFNKQDVLTCIMPFNFSNIR